MKKHIPKWKPVTAQHLTKTILKKNLIQRSIYTHKLPWRPVTAQHTKKMYLQHQGTIAAAMGGEDTEEAIKEAKKIKLSCCSRTGQNRLNKPRPSSVTFQHHEDKQKLLESKRNLPSGVYINEEFPAHKKRNRDISRLIL